MDLIVLGNNGPYPAAYGATSGYLVRTEKGFTALDMGSGVFSRISKLCPPEKISAVVLSHLHFDHISDMGVFNYYLELLAKHKKFRGRIPCYVPPLHKEIDRLQEEYPYFRFIGVKGDGKYSFGGMSAEFCKLNHGVLNYGVRLTEDVTGKKLVYTGDSNVCPNLERLIKNCHLWVGSAPFIGKEYTKAGGHLSIDVMQELAEEYDIPAIASHLNPLHSEKDYERVIKGDFVTIAKPFKSYHV